MASPRGNLRVDIGLNIIDVSNREETVAAALVAMKTRTISAIVGSRVIGGDNR